MADIDKELEALYQIVRAGKDPDTGFLHITKEEFVSKTRQVIGLPILERIKEEIPEYWPNCEKYPDSMGTYCNNCRWCKNRNRDDLVTGYEWANDDLKTKLDNIAKEIRGEGGPNPE